jgi:hypothetical protein
VAIGGFTKLYFNRQRFEEHAIDRLINKELLLIEVFSQEQYLAFNKIPVFEHGMNI